MDHKTEFLEIVAKYCDKEASELTEDMRFREDLGFNSLSSTSNSMRRALCALRPSARRSSI